MKSATFSRSAGTPPVAVPLTCNSGAHEPCSSADRGVGRQPGLGKAGRGAGRVEHRVAGEGPTAYAIRKRGPVRHDAAGAGVGLAGLLACAGCGGRDGGREGSDRPARRSLTAQLTFPGRGAPSPVRGTIYAKPPPARSAAAKLPYSKPLTR